MTTITITTPYRCEAIVDIAEDGTPFIAAVNSLELPFEGEHVDVAWLVLTNTNLFAKLNSRVMQEYAWQTASKVMKTHAETLKKLGEE